MTELSAQDGCRVCGEPVGFMLPLPVEGSLQPWCKRHCPAHNYVWHAYARKMQCALCEAEPPNDFFIYDNEGLHSK